MIVECIKLPTTATLSSSSLPDSIPEFSETNIQLTRNTHRSTMSKSFFSRVSARFTAVNPEYYTIGRERLPPIINLLAAIPSAEVGDPPFQLFQAVGEDDSSAVTKVVRDCPDKTLVNTLEAGTGLTALHYASDASTFLVVQALLDRGADIHAKDASGSTALHIASFAGNVDIVTELLRRGATVDARDGKGNTPLLGAAECGHLAVVNALLRAGADADAPNADMARPLAISMEREFQDVFISLIRAGADSLKVVGEVDYDSD